MHLIRKAGNAFICLVVFLTFQTSCSRESYEEKQAKLQQAGETKEAQEQAHLTELINTFATKHEADGSWKDGLKNHVLSTIELQQALIRSDSRPILAMGNLMDIEQHRGKPRLLFHIPGVGLSSLQKQHLILSLSCPLPESEIHSLRIDEFNYWRRPEYLVAAHVRTVRQAHQFIQTHLREGNSSSSLDTVEMEFIAEGKCVALQHIQNVKEEGNAEKTKINLR